MEDIHMNGETASVSEGARQGEDGQARQRSTISFPYVDIGAAFDLVNAIHSHVGLGECDEDQLAAWTNQSAKSSGFREQVRAARMAALVESASGKFRLTPLGRLIVDPNRAPEGKAGAFLNVPLFGAVFEKYRGGDLPPPAALERDIVGLGVSEKQKDRARQVLEKSADQAGFFEHGKNRLVMPAIAIGPTTLQPGHSEPQQREAPNPKGAGGDGGDEFGLDPLLIALLKKVPPPDKSWPGPARVRWFRTFAMNVSQIYDGDGDPVEMKIELEKEAAN
jgi:hypothetical protein